MTSKLVRKVSLYAVGFDVEIKQKKAGSTDPSFSAAPINYRPNIRRASQSQSAPRVVAKHLTKNGKRRPSNDSNDDTYASSISSDSDDSALNRFLLEASKRKDSINLINSKISRVPNRKYSFSNGSIEPIDTDNTDFQISSFSAYHPVDKKLAYITPEKWVLERSKDLMKKLHHELVVRKTCRTWKDLFYMLTWFLGLYSMLIILLVVMLTIFTRHLLTVNYPRLTGMDSALRLDPGLSYVPVVDFHNNIIHFRVSDVYIIGVTQLRHEIPNYLL
ncbi:hypothetical protein Ciccas_002871 [Cichlidogyrus casuarinus]|uniref:Uncharacterized protein n=1 Tax=Cichlidogyrus casuarinus TaxID=1844966 RepID=A0ABD2QFZ7_9PLAT